MCPPQSPSRLPPAPLSCGLSYSSAELSALPKSLSEPHFPAVLWGMKNSWENPLESSVLGPPTGSSFLALLPCFSIRRTEPSLFHVCYLGLLFSFLFFFFFLCLLCLAPGYHLLSPCLSIPWCLLPDLPAPHGCCRQCRAGRLCKISRYLPRKKSPPFLCTSVAVPNTH